MSDKHIYAIMSEKGISGEREYVNGIKQSFTWKGVSFIRGSKGSNGFQTYEGGNDSSNSMSSEEVSSLDSFTGPENRQKMSLNDDWKEY